MNFYQFNELILKTLSRLDGFKSVYDPSCDAFLMDSVKFQKFEKLLNSMRKDAIILHNEKEQQEHKKIRKQLNIEFVKKYREKMTNSLFKLYKVSFRKNSIINPDPHLRYVYVVDLLFDSIMNLNENYEELLNNKTIQRYFNDNFVIYDLQDDIDYPYDNNYSFLYTKFLSNLTNIASLEDGKNECKMEKLSILLSEKLNQVVFCIKQNEKDASLYSPMFEKYSLKIYNDILKIFKKTKVEFDDVGREWCREALSDFMVNSLKV